MSGEDQTSPSVQVEDMSSPDKQYPLHGMAGVDGKDYTQDDYIEAIGKFRLMDVPEKISNGMTPFHACVITGNLKYLKALTLMDEGGSDCDIRDNEGRTPFSYACEEGNIEIVKILMSKACDLVSGDIRDITPLGYAAGGGHIEICRLLLEVGVSSNS